MDPDSLHYLSGEEVHAGDRVQYKSNFATVVFVSNGETEEFSPGYEDYAGWQRGILVCDDDGGTAELGEADENLSFVDRG